MHEPKRDITALFDFMGEVAEPQLEIKVGYGTQFFRAVRTGELRIKSTAQMSFKERENKS